MARGRSSRQHRSSAMTEIGYVFNPRPDILGAWVRESPALRLSVPANEKPIPISPEEQKHCDHEGHLIYKELEKRSKK